MSLTFKKFLEADESQLNELFGTFRNNKQQPNDQRQSKAGASEKDKELEWKLAQQTAKNKRPLTPAEKNKIKDKMFADARAKHGDSANPVSVRESEGELLVDQPGYQLFAEGDTYTIKCDLDGEQREFTIVGGNTLLDESGQPVSKEVVRKICDQHQDAHVDALLKIVDRHGH